MKKNTWTVLVLSIIFSGIILNLGNSLQVFEEYDENYPLGSSNSDSWSKIIEEGEYYSTSHCELVNGSLYVFGYRSVSKYNTSGFKVWEQEIPDFFRISYVFDNDNNLFFLSSHLTLIKINSSGALLFSKDFSLDTYHSESSLILGENNSLVVVSNSYNYTNPNPWSVLIMKINNAGQLLWNTSLSVEFYDKYPRIVKDSEYNMYLYLWNNSICSLAKINGSGTIVWQMSAENRITKLIVDSNDNLFIIGEQDYSTGYILKLNKTGDLIKELIIESFKTYANDILFLNDILVLDRYSMSFFCYDLNLELKWEFSLSNYITDHFLLRTYLAKDSHDNVYILQNNELGNLNIVKISSTGVLLSRIIWGGVFTEMPASLNIDLDDNIYFTCKCDFYNNWQDKLVCTILVKNPAHGGIPPEPKWDLDERDFFLFSVLGIVCIISPIALRSILKSNKKRTG